MCPKYWKITYGILQVSDMHINGFILQSGTAASADSDAANMRTDFFFATKHAFRDNRAPILASSWPYVAAAAAIATST